MGKSSKKVRNDRINTIRKQYDAFLEEDKKRRERNEYILGKLDKMRSSTALVPILSTVNHQMELNSAEIYLRPNNKRTKPEMDDSYISHLERQNVNSGVLHKHVDEINVLKEISKKFILIPKRSTAIETDYFYKKDVIDDDWKSKYNILDDLKRLEKEGEPDPAFNQNKDNYMHNERLELSKDSYFSDEKPPTLSNNPNNVDKPISGKNNETTTPNKNKLLEEPETFNRQINFNVPEINNQDNEENEAPLQIASMSSNDGMTVDQTQSSHSAAQEVIVNSQQENVTEKEKYNSEGNEKDLHLTQNINNYLQVHEVSNSNDPIDYQESIHQADYHNNISTAATNKYIEPENTREVTSNANISEEVLGALTPQESCPVPKETVNLNKSIEIKIEGNQNVGNEIQKLTSTENVELYDDIDKNPEGQINSNETNFVTHYDPSQNTVPTVLENIQHLDHAEHESEINAFEAEQKEMFYSEQAGADTYAYNEGDGNTVEYTDVYEQNDQYAYYEGVQQEQAYATNIDEHEESTERYDPHYNEQYEGSYGNQQPDNPVDYENSNAYEQQQYQDNNPQFENIDNYENQQENSNFYQQENMSTENEAQENILPSQDNQIYDQHLYTVQPETQEHIEQQLITEEGYIENTPVIADTLQKENEGEIEKVINVNTPEEIMPDPKLT